MSHDLKVLCQILNLLELVDSKGDLLCHFFKSLIIVILESFRLIGVDKAYDSWYDAFQEVK